MTNLDDIEGAEFDDAERELRRYAGFAHIEQEHEGDWLEMVDVLMRYHDEHLHYPTEIEFGWLWHQECDAQIKLIKKVLGRGLQ